MIFVRHRVNSLSDLSELGNENGVEIDVRTYQNRLVLSHDPFTEGEHFEDWLEGFAHELLVINVKEDGLEEAIENAIVKSGKEIEFLFLDQSFPTIARRIERGVLNSMLRVSDYECAQTLEKLPNMPTWVWVDSFREQGLRTIDLTYLRGMSKIMICSPELQGRNLREEAVSMLSHFSDLGFLPDAICTKNPLVWEELVRNGATDLRAPPKI